MIETITFKDKTYPKFQSIGMGSQYAIPYAKHVCVGEGYDIIIKDYMVDKGYKKIFVSEIDLNNAFMVMGEK